MKIEIFIQTKYFFLLNLHKKKISVKDYVMFFSCSRTIGEKEIKREPILLEKGF